MPTLTKEQVLEYLGMIGKGIKRNADPSTYSSERRYQAETYAEMLPGLRTVYNQIAKGADAVQQLKVALNIVKTGISHNEISLLLKACQDNASEEQLTHLDKCMKTIVF